MTVQSNGNGAPNGNGAAHGSGAGDHYTTRAIHVGSEPDALTGAVVPGLSVATTFAQDGIGKDRGHDYSRSSNPTRSLLEAQITSLETGSNAGETLVYASGSAATSALASWVSLAAIEGGAGGKDGKSGGGGHVLAINDVYGGTARYLSRAARSTGLEVTYFDFVNAGEAEIRAAIRPDTRLLWLEVPTNPLLLVPNLPLISEVVNSLPAETRPLLVVDTTFLSSFFFTPLVAKPGAKPLGDIVLSSLSKYSGGHSDIILGSVTLSETTKAIRPELIKGLRFIQNSHGGIPSPRDAHLLIRSLKTLSVRTLRHALNALQIADWLSKRPEVEKVRYPGLKTAEGFQYVETLLSGNARRELEYLGWKFPYKTQTSTEATSGLEYVRTAGIPFGGVITFTLKNASAEETEAFVLKLRLIALAESLGGVESLIEVPAGMTHQGLPAATREALGITSSLVRFSVGIEDVDDLIGDLEQAFAALSK